MIHILVLEDDMETLSVILKELSVLEEEIEKIDPQGIRVTIYTTYEDVERFVNNQNTQTYDVILLDRDCKLGGSFHALDIGKFGPDRIISISSTPQWNIEAKARGITRVVWKDYTNLDTFGVVLKQEMLDLLVATKADAR